MVLVEINKAYVFLTFTFTFHVHIHIPLLLLVPQSTHSAKQHFKKHTFVAIATHVGKQSKAQSHHNKKVYFLKRKIPNKTWTWH